MKKRKFGYKLSRGKGARLALFRGLVISLVENGSIKTTKTKAKAVTPEIEKLVKLAKKGDLASRRIATARLANDRKTADKMFNYVAKAFSERKGGFVKVTDLGKRRGDLASMVRMEWSVEVVDEKAEAVKLKKSKAVGQETKTKGVLGKLKIKGRSKKNK